MRNFLNNFIAGAGISLILVFLRDRSTILTNLASQFSEPVYNMAAIAVGFGIFAGLSYISLLDFQRKNYKEKQASLNKARLLLKDKHYSQVVIEAFAVCESVLRTTLNLGQEVDAFELGKQAENTQLFDQKVTRSWHQLRMLRNRIVHERYESSKDDAENALANASRIVAKAF